METPICDFVREYAKSDPVRMHMPGHKGKPLTGPEAFDLTEIGGADVLYRSEGPQRKRGFPHGCWPGGMPIIP